MRPGDAARIITSEMGELDYSRSVGHHIHILIVEGHPKDSALHIDQVELAAGVVKNLDALEVADVDAALVVDGNT